MSDDPTEVDAAIRLARARYGTRWDGLPAEDLAAAAAEGPGVLRWRVGPYSI